MPKVRSRKYYKALVWHGSRLLTSKDPEWFTDTAIAVPALDLGDPYTCVLGQRFDSFYNGKKSLDLSQKEAVMYGFDIAEGTQPYNEAYSRLTECWIEEIHRLRADV